MKRACELCKSIARIHCESDRARLCWDCDAKVHSANFLVARHSRNLLCRVCQFPTRWSASGSALEPTISYCQQCVNGRICGETDEVDEEETVEDEVEEEEMGENQVPAWSPPPPASESSSRIEESGCEVATSRKRGWLENDQPSPNDRDTLSSHLNILTSPSDSAAEVTSTASDSTSRRISAPPRKIRNTCPDEARVFESGILESLRRFGREETVSKMAESGALSGGPGTIEPISSDSG